MAKQQEAADGEGSAAPVPEEGEGPPAEEAHAMEKPAGQTDIDDALQFEVVTLALSTLQDIAGEIALRVRKWARGEASLVLVGIADDDFSAGMAEWQALATRMGVLEAAMEEFLQEREAEAARLEAIPLAPIQEATAAVEAVAHLLSFFKVDTTYEGRKPDLDNSALYPAVAGRLIEAGMRDVLFGSNGIAGAAASTSFNLIGRLERLLRLKIRLQAILPDSPKEEPEKEPEGEEPAPDEPVSEAAKASSGATKPAPAGGSREQAPPPQPTSPGARGPTGRRGRRRGRGRRFEPADQIPCKCRRSVGKRAGRGRRQETKLGRAAGDE